jgi:hypothetical protein
MAIPWIDLAESLALVVYASWWAYDLRKGLVVRGWSMALRAFFNVLVFLWIVFAATALLGGTTTVYKLAPPVADDIALLLIPVWILLVVIFAYSIRAGRRFAQHRLIRERSTTGQVRIGGLAAFPALWLILALAQLGLETYLLHGLSLDLPVFSQPLAGVPWWMLLASGFVGYFVYATSLGLMAGFALAVRAGARQLQQGSTIATSMTSGPQTVGLSAKK